MEFLQQKFSVPFEYKVFFTEHLFSTSNDLLRSFLEGRAKEGVVPKVLVVVDDGVLLHHGGLVEKIKQYFGQMSKVKLVEHFVVLPGGETVKNNEHHFYQIIEAIDEYGIDRHSYVLGLGGGSILDVTGYAAAVAHRGIRHIRVPTTVLSQNDSGVGVKNGINFFSKKNFLGTFAPPVAVFNDSHFLSTLDDGEWRSGVSEAIKVALIKDPSFFVWIEQHAQELVDRSMAAMTYLIKRCAELHLQHIASADPFETGSSRPLDFGHWSAHKLEQLTGFSIRHGDAVAIGIALDTVYSTLSRRLDEQAMKRVVNVLQHLQFEITHPLLDTTDELNPLLAGLNEFREHLGGRLTIMLLRDIGVGEEVHQIDSDVVKKAYQRLKELDINQ
jgi:3-dehydroquinate synthase